MRTRIYLYPVLLGAFISVQAFTFSNNVPTECGNFEVSWTGGQEPFVLEVAPVEGTQRVFNIPASAFSNGAGKFNIPQLTLARGTQVLVAMSDAIGFATGGISPLLTVGAPTGAATCNSTDPGPNFFYSLNDPLQQCKPYTFSDFPGAIQPVTIFGLVPGGKAIVLNVPNPSTEFVWTASVSAGTEIVFVMSDSQNQTGGVSPLKVSSATNDASCLNSNSPSATLQGTSSTPSIYTSPTTSSSSERTSNSSKGPGATLAAAIAGVLVGLIALVALSLFLFRRNKSRRPRGHVDLNDGYRDEPSSLLPYTMDRFPPPNPTNNTHYETPHMGSSTTNLGPPPVAAVAATVLPSLSSSTSSSVPSSRTRSTYVTASTTRHQPARFIVHTDVEDGEGEPDDNVIDLPPEYDEHRQPLSFRTGTGSAPSESVPSSSLTSYKSKSKR